MDFNTVCVVGLGYIGLPTAAVFAGRRKKVIGVDVNQNAVDTINRGEIHIVEPELDIAVHAAVKEGYLHATTEPETSPHNLRPPQCNHHGALVRRARKRKGFASSSNAIQRRNQSCHRPRTPTPTRCLPRT